MQELAAHMQYSLYRAVCAAQQENVMSDYQESPLQSYGTPRWVTLAVIASVTQRGVPYDCSCDSW